MKTRLLLAMAVLVALGAVLAYTLSEKPHRFSAEQCRECHYDPDGAPSALRAPVTMLCRGCHSALMERSTHPNDVVPHTAFVPPDLPLDNGKVTCNTCHNIHSSPTIVFGIRSYFLRRQVSDIKDFCVACHADNLERPGHKELFILAHEANKYVVTDLGDSIDPLSAECIGCHDGSIGPAVEFKLGSGIWMHAGSGHPIGVNYNEARMRGSDLRPMQELDRNIRLFDGRVGCATCHDWFLEKGKRLVVEISGSGLCVECHIGK